MDKSKIREHLEEANQHVKKGEKLIEQHREAVR
jgi:5-bromo-4-chloroindolyl phosphate hydrolysis protein